MAQAEQRVEAEAEDKRSIAQLLVKKDHSQRRKKRKKNVKAKKLQLKNKKITEIK